MGRDVVRKVVNGILLVDKPVGQTSNQTLQEVKNIFKASKAGHTGNLDLLASGLLPVCFGEATKVSQFLLDSDKLYEAEFILGRTTSTGDYEGEETSAAGTSDIDAHKIHSAIKKLTGEIFQTPPMYSALKVNGKRLYQLARRGLTVKRENRPVKIYSFEVLTMDVPKILVRVRCSKGTYIRVLAEDLGRLLNCGAFMSKLKRISSGPFHLMNSYTPDVLKKLETSKGSSYLKSLLLRADMALAHLPEVLLSKSDTQSLKFGQQIVLGESFEITDRIRLYDESGNFFGLGQVTEPGIIRPKRLFNL
jgi:tRNA pseudouridine55 synthase